MSGQKLPARQTSLPDSCEHLARPAYPPLGRIMNMEPLPTCVLATGPAAKRRKMTKKAVLALITTMLLYPLMAQELMRMEEPTRPYVIRSDGDRLTCGRATQTEMRSIRELIDRGSPPSRSRFGKSALAPPAASITVNYTGFTQEAQAAFQRAVDIWSALLITKVPIEIDASFGEIDSLGSASPAQFFKFTTGSFFYPAGIVNQKMERDADPDEPEIEVTMSDSRDWYYGLDGNPGENQHDFVSVVLHEIGHGLGIVDSFRSEEDGSARFGSEVAGEDSGELYPFVFDVWIFDRDFNHLTGIGDTPGDFINPSEELFEALTGIKLFWAGKEASEANGGRLNNILLWAPEEFDEGSSVAHLDQDAYPPGTSNELMHPFLPKGKAIHDPGPIVLGMLSDMGWTIRETTLQIPHFGAGEGISSDVVVTNLSWSETATVAVDAWDENGVELDGILLFGDNRFTLRPLGSHTLSADESDFRSGSITVSSDVPVSAVVRFDIPGAGIAGVGTSPEVREAIAPVRRIGTLSTGVAIRNVELSDQTIKLTLKNESGVTVTGGRSSRSIEAGGRIAEFVQELFPRSGHYPIPGGDSHPGAVR